MSNPRSFSSALRRAWRSLTRRPGSFAIAVSSLAIALGLATTVIAQIDALMNPVSPMRDAKNVYLLTLSGAVRTGQPGPTHDDVFDVLRTSAVIERVARVEAYRLDPLMDAMRRGPRIVRLSPEFFEAADVRPARGRVFTKYDDGTTDVALVSESHWKAHFAGRVALDSAGLAVQTGRWPMPRWHRIVGVLPDLRAGSLAAEIYLPKGNGPVEMNLMHVVRVKRGVSKAQLDTSVTAAAGQLVARFGVGSRRIRLETRSLQPDPLQLTTFHRALAGASLFIVLIACANVSALMLARSVTQRRDQALRRALGAGARDLMRDVAAELTIIAALGCIAGLIIGAWAMQVLIAATPPELGWMGFAQPRWNIRVFGGLLLAVLTTVGLSAMVPAWQVSKVDPAEPLKDASGTTTGRPGRRFQVLVVAELALAMILLLGANLVTKTAANVAAFDFGYDARSLVDFTVGALVSKPGSAPTPASLSSMAAIPDEALLTLVERVRRAPGVKDAAWMLPGGFRAPIASDAKYAIDTASALPRARMVGPGFIRTLGLPVVAGRDFVEGDARGGGAAILDESLAKALFPDGQAVGHLVSFLRNGNATTWIPVVGVVRHAIHEIPEYPEMPSDRALYFMPPSRVGWNPSLIVRPTSDAVDINPAVTGLIRDLGGVRQTAGKQWIAKYEEMLRGRRFIAGIFIALSVASLALATAGLFGVLSYAVGQRMREFAVRVALGAQAPNIVRLVARDGFVMALGGTALGGLVGMTAGFAVYDWLWGVYPVDAAALIIAEVILLAVTMASAIGPALRASRANPVEVMRAS